MDLLKGLKVIHLNIRSLAPKIDLLRTWVMVHKPDIITISETWLHSDIPDNDVLIDNFVLYRTDRPSRGGGVATYVSVRLTSEMITPSEAPLHFESIFVNIIFHQNKRLTIGNIYRPPSAPAESTNCILSTISSLPNNNELVILGDFNKNWLDRTSSLDKTLFKSINLTQLISEPTRVDLRSSSLLDWILVSNPDRVLKSGVLSDPISDHSFIFCIWKIKTTSQPPKYITFRQSKAMDIDSFINDIVNINWSRFQLIPSVEEAWNFFYSEFINVVNKHAPLRTIRVKGRHLPWINSYLINLYKKRDMAWRKYRLSKGLDDWETYRQLRNFCKTETRNAKSTYYKNSLSQEFRNPKQFWNKLNGMLNRSDKKHIGQLNINNIATSDPELISNAFNKHFTSIGGSNYFNTFDNEDFLLQPSPSCSFSFNDIAPADVFNAICSIKGNSCGPDGLETKFLKLAAHVIMYPLADLFNLSLKTCTIPSIWKCARVTPIFKSGDSADINNYRPISIMCNVAKVFEKLLSRQLSDYIVSNNILSSHQSGFRSSYSTTTALLKFTNDIYSSLESGHITGAIFIDLSKAFDMVDHYLLLDKLAAIGLNRDALLWFNSYLHNRRQYVVFQGIQSNNLINSHGVPQGSILGPLLFSIFINELPRICQQCSIHLYADDTVIYFSDTNPTAIQNSLQTDFNLLQKWFYNNKLLLNTKKSCCMVFGSKPSHPDQLDLKIQTTNGSDLERVSSFKYLGLWIDPELTFKPHIDYIVKKCQASLSSLYRASECFTFEVRKRLITQLIFPILDYADIIYMNTTDYILYPINVLFNSLCRFILKCPFRTHHCFMYNSLSLLSPKARRRYHWVLFIFKCVYFTYPPYLKDLLVCSTGPYNLRHSHYPYFLVPRFFKTIARRSFQYRAPNDWNNLSVSLRSTSSFNCFKSLLFSHLSLQCTCF